MEEESRIRRYRELQSYVGWDEGDARRVVALMPLVEPALPALIDDFYDAIDRHPAARKVLDAGQAQVDRLKQSLIRWVRELFLGQYDEEYVRRRWRVGWRHVEIGLDQVYTNVALSRLRSGLSVAVRAAWMGDPAAMHDSLRSLSKLLDLDLAIIEDAYQDEYAVRLRRKERLATLGQVAGGVAHELRNPLNVVKTSVYYLRNARRLDSEKAAEHLRRIERNVDLADGVITSLSSFTRMREPSLQPVSLARCVAEALELNPPGDGVEVGLDCPESLPPALADPDQLRIVVGNLIRNALDAMPGGGRLTIAARPDGAMVALEVEDTGVGIPRGDLARIVEPLFSTKARGMGLGLAIARSILDKLQGTLGVVSEPGVGSCFTVRLRSATAG